jgi:hypothetical protein
MPDTAAHLIERALECERKATLTIDETQRRTLLDLAKAWRQMAADYEELSRADKPNALPPSPTNRS